ncbi:adrenocorticotropic hormone receptor-like [Oculina patagonica]
MANISSSNFTNIGLTKIGKEGEAPNNLYVTNCIITVIINSITCPLTVLLNVFVIMAVKRRPRLQSNTNILLACLATTDVFTGLAVQPSFIVWKIYVELLGMTESETLFIFHRTCIRTASVCSSLHLMLVTCERLIAIKFTMNYPYLVTKPNIKVAVIAVWIVALLCGVSRAINSDAILTFFNFVAVFTIVSCVLFILCSYVILYRETLRHKKKIKTQQLPQEEVERFAKESKALKTTVYIVGAVVLCFAPLVFVLMLMILGLSQTSVLLSVFKLWARTFFMLNSILNPLIYCWRQKEMRKFVFRFPTQVVHPAN